MADGGYDVADYRDIDPLFGTLAEAEALIAEAAALGHPRPSSTSSRTTAPTSTAGSRRRSRPGPGSPERERFWFRPGRGADGELPPNDWLVRSSAAPPGRGPTNPDGTPGEWYLHLFAPEQPDLNWDAPGGARASTRTCCASGSTAAWTASASTRRRCSSRTRRCPTSTRAAAPAPHPFTDRDELHEVYRSWRAVADGYGGDADPDRRGLAAGRRSASPATCAPTSCTRRSTSTSWPARGTPSRLRESIDATLAAHAPVGAPATWVLSNHDVTRHVTRYGRDGHDVRLRRQDATASRRSTSRSARAGPARPRCSRWRCPAPSTSTRARSSACRRSRTCRTTCSRTRCSTAPAAPTRAATAAGCRCRGRGDGAAVRLQPAGAAARPGCRSPTRGARSRVEAQAGDPARCSRSTAPRSASGAPSPALGDGPMRWLEPRDGRARVHARRRLRLRREPLGRRRSSCPRTRRSARERPARGRPAAAGHGGLAADLPTVIVRNLQIFVSLLRYFDKSAMLSAVTRARTQASALAAAGVAACWGPGDLGKEGR